MPCTRWSPGIRNLAARFHQRFDEPVQMIPADPAARWHYVELHARARHRMR